MPGCAMLTYNNVSAAAWQSIKQAVSNLNVQISVDAGSAKADGFTVSWNYQAASGILSIQCTARPLLVPCSTINAKINDEVEACLDQHNAMVSNMMS